MYWKLYKMIQILQYTIIKLWTTDHTSLERSCLLLNSEKLSWFRHRVRFAAHCQTLLNIHIVSQSRIQIHTKEIIKSNLNVGSLNKNSDNNLLNQRTGHYNQYDSPKVKSPELRLARAYSSNERFSRRPIHSGMFKIAFVYVYTDDEHDVFRVSTHPTADTRRKRQFCRNEYVRSDEGGRTCQEMCGVRVRTTTIANGQTHDATTRIKMKYALDARTSAHTNTHTADKCWFIIKTPSFISVQYCCLHTASARNAFRGVYGLAATRW